MSDAKDPGAVQAAAEKAAAAEAAAEQAAAEAAFRKTATGEVPNEPEPAKVEPEPEKEPAPAAAKPAAEPSAEDKAKAERERVEREKREEEEWLKAQPTKVRETYAAISDLVGRLRNVEGHIGGLTSAQKQLKAAIEAATKATTKAGAATPSAAEVAAATESLKKWKQMKEDFPEWAEALEERLSAERRFDAPTIDVEKLRAELREEISRDLNLERVEEVHPGWQETVRTPEFKAWFYAQPESDRALADSTKARDAIKLLDKYFESRKQPAAKPPAEDPNKARLEAAVPPTRGTTVTRSEGMTEQQAAEAAFRRIRRAAL